MNSLGYRLAVDTSLRLPRSSATASRAAAPLLDHVETIGAYFSQQRKCIGIAMDSAWHEAVHELCHAQFDARVRHAAGPQATRLEPLRLHWERLRSLGHSEHAAEQLVCHTHELQALRARPSVAAASRAIVVWDNMNLDAYRDLAAVPPAQRTTRQAAELRRLALLRALVTGPAPRVGGLMTLVVGVVTIVGQMVRQAGGK